METVSSGWKHPIFDGLHTIGFLLKVNRLPSAGQKLERMLHEFAIGEAEKRGQFSHTGQHGGAGLGVQAKLMDGTLYIPNARTAEEHLNNVRFQLENVEGWLLGEHRANAAIKADCLLEAAQGLVAAFKLEERAAKAPRKL